MYAWSQGDCIMGVPSASVYYRQCGAASALTFQTQLLNNMTAPFGGAYPPFNRLYVYFNPTYLTTRTAAVSSFLMRAHAAGVAVELLDGDGSWVTSLTLREIPVATCEAVATFNAAAANDSARLDGVHLDIEPHTVGGWVGNNTIGADAYNDFYQANVLHIFAQCRAALNGTAAVVGWDVSDDYYRWVGDLWTPMLTGAYASYVTVMAYYGSQQGFWNGTGGTGGVFRVLNSVQGSPINAVFAIETQNPSFLPWDPTITVWPNGTDAAEGMLAATVAQFSPDAHFLGTAVHFDKPYFRMGALGPIAPPSLRATACTTSGSVVTVTADPFYFKCYQAQREAPGGWTQTASRAVSAWTSTYTFSSSGPYRVVLYDTSSCTTTFNLAVTQAC
jgi:hypothetical protein